MSLDVTAEVRIARDPQTVWRLMTDPAREPEWIGGLKEARLIGEPPLREGSRVRRVGGTRLSALMAPLVRRNIQRDLDRLGELAEPVDGVRSG
jgi:uncharacterized protein YndB with AHSA1/START domain